MTDSAPGSPLPVADRWFNVTEVSDGIYRVTEPHVHAYVRSNAWLIRGSVAHLLVDTGLGVGRLSDELGGLLDRPVTAVVTHAHFDHVGGLGEFAERAAHPDDGAVIEAGSDYVTLRAATYPAGLVDEFEAVGEAVPDLLIDAVPVAGFDVDGFRTLGVGITRWLADGDAIDLGDRIFTVLHAPGHTPGSICLWEAGSQTLLSGDVLVDGEPLQDWVPRSSPPDFAASLRRLAQLPLRTVYAGHGPVFGESRARDIVAGYLAGRS